MRNWSRYIPREVGDKLFGTDKTDLVLDGIELDIYSTSEAHIVERASGEYAIFGNGIAFDHMDKDTLLYVLLDFADAYDTARGIIAMGNYDAAVALMDDEVREYVHSFERYCEDEQHFLTAYIAAHQIAFGEDFEVN